MAGRATVAASRIILTVVAAVLAPWVTAHEMRSGYLEVRERNEGAYEVRWKMPVSGSGEVLELDFGEGIQVVGEPVTATMAGSTVQRMNIIKDDGLPGSELVIIGLERTVFDVLLRFEMADGREVTHRITPESPSYVFEADPSRWRLAWTYLVIGIEHILLGVDHLLFVLGLLLLVDRRWMLVKTVTSFTIAHSITLALSVFAIIEVPPGPLNAAIALSILFLGPEIVRKWRGGDSLTIRHPWVVAFLFGLLHGIGFASGLSVTGVPVANIPVALLFFNVGVEVGQLAFVVVALLAAQSLHLLELDRPDWVRRIPGYVIGTLGAYWTIQRVLLIFSETP